jgi:uncharacterized protein (DUF1697 family)
MNCIALIRGINVGKTKRIAMVDLQQLFTDLGHRNVRTLLNSGNVVFETKGFNAAKLRAAVEQAMAAKFGFTASVTVVSAPELKRIIDENPMLKVAKDHSRHFIAFAADSAALQALRPLLEQPWKPDVLAITPRAAYLWCEAGAIDSKLSQVFGRKAGGSVTLRNWATVLKIHSNIASPTMRL